MKTSNARISMFNSETRKYASKSQEFYAYTKLPVIHANGGEKIHE
jgi:hypothetical protein